MSRSHLPDLPEYQELRDLLETERKTIIKVNAFSEDDDYVRSNEDALLLLDFIEDIHLKLWAFFEKHPNLLPFFDKEMTSFHQFVSRETVLDLIFLDDCLFPEKEMFFYGQDGGIDPAVLALHKETFENWMHEREKAHFDTINFIKTQFNGEVKPSELSCHCIVCVADYRTRLRDYIYEESLVIIKQAEQEIDENIDLGIELVGNIYFQMQKRLDQIFHRNRNRLKRSTLNKLDSQIKNVLLDYFAYPAPLVKRYTYNIRPLFDSILQEEELPTDLVTEQEYERFFTQISRNIWKGERYLDREFRKLVRSVVILKRKDVSSKILQDYLGEFWVHSQARSLKRKIIYHMGPTNSGKTYHAINRLAEMKTGCYLAPLRLLAGELYDTLNQKGVKTTLLTGEEVIEVEGSTHYSSTIEMARLHQPFDCCVIDEIQMISDPQRGWAWTRALVNIFCEEIHICGDPSVYELIKEIAELCGDTLEIKNYERMTELVVDPRPIYLGDLEKSDALIVFSRKNALRYKADLERLGFRVSIVYGRLSPEVRREQARKFDSGETDIIVSTDAIAMGMNLPIKRIIFSTLSKFIDSQEFEITSSEIKQIAGRAGRYLRFPTGHVTCLTKVEDGLEKITEALREELDQKTKCMVGPDLDIFGQVNSALQDNGLPGLKLSDFLRLFNTMTFKRPFYCVELKEMIELAEMVEEADQGGNLSISEIFGFACAPVNLGLLEHVQYYLWILNHYVFEKPIKNEEIDHQSANIDYLETSIKCVELYQWLSRHFDNKNFYYDEQLLLENKSKAIEKLNDLLSDKIARHCSSCGVNLPEEFQFNICEDCFSKRRGRRGDRFSKSRFKDKRPSGGNFSRNNDKKKPFHKKKRSRKRRSGTKKR